jgi:predicted ribosome quality control (RQC) complex YloA/Tae2 family protein
MKHIIHCFSNIPVAIEYYIGCNTRENSYILDMARIHDLWFHVEQGTSCHVLARIPRGFIKLTKKQRITIIKMGCILCKINTTGLKEQSNVKINYTEVKNIEKSEQDGVLYTKNLKVYTV